jgi:outer membrane protein OmpA-like peptidoglycan-associated protein
MNARTRAGLLLLLPVFLLMAACSSQWATRTLVVLLEESDGHVGEVGVTTAAGTTVLDEAGEASVAADPEKLPSEGFAMETQEVESIFGPALAVQPQGPATFILYFKPDSEELTEESLSLLAEILDAVASRRSVDTSVIGHTDTVGTKKYNYELSKKRAQAVGDLLVTRGVDPVILQVTSHGEENPVVPTDDEIEEPRNRRVEVTVR